MDENTEKLVSRMEALELELNQQRMLSHYKIPGELVETDLSIKHLMVLLSLSIKDNSTMSELSEKAALNLSTLTRAVDRLVDESFVIRQNDPGDRRIVRVSLSSKAKAILEKINRQRRELMASFFEGLARAEREKFVSLFENLIKMLSGEKA